MGQLRAQDHLFTVLEKGAEGNQPIIIGAVKECLNAKLDSLAAIIEKFCEPQVAIVSLTITEKATVSIRRRENWICGTAASCTILSTRLSRIPRRVFWLKPFIAAASGPAGVYRALLRQYSRQRPCGENAVLGMAGKRSAELAAWIEAHVSFHGTMVDRIVPAATDASLAEITRELGVEDPCAISCEPFIQWVVEDNFVAGRPEWEVAGVQMVEDVLPWGR